jgi:hypothetical protein
MGGRPRPAPDPDRADLYDSKNASGSNPIGSGGGFMRLSCLEGGRFTPTGGYRLGAPPFLSQQKPNARSLGQVS